MLIRSYKGTDRISASELPIVPVSHAIEGKIGHEFSARRYVVIVAGIFCSVAPTNLLTAIVLSSAANANNLRLSIYISPHGPSRPARGCKIVGLQFYPIFTVDVDIGEADVRKKHLCLAAEGIYWITGTPPPPLGVVFSVCPPVRPHPTRLF